MGIPKSELMLICTTMVKFKDIAGKLVSRCPDDCPELQELVRQMDMCDAIIDKVNMLADKYRD